MREEYDYAWRGLHPGELWSAPPAYLEPQRLSFLAIQAQQRGLTLDELLSQMRGPANWSLSCG